MHDSAAVIADRIDVSFGHVNVISQLSTRVARGSTVGLVGESGSGKSTLGKAIVGMNRVSAGSLDVVGHDMRHLSRRERHTLSRTVQYIPQDPYSSLSPRRTIRQTLAEAIDPRAGRLSADAEALAVATLTSVGLGGDVLAKYPHEFSGGQRQRIAIARALLPGPELIIADEITSALDVSVQAEIIELLKRLRGERPLTMVFISHSLAVVEQLCEEIIVMQRGAIVEHGPITEVFHAPSSPYTRQLLASVPGSPGFDLDGGAHQ